MTGGEVLRFIGRCLFTVLRMTFIIFCAIVLGGLRGASKARMSSSSPRD